MVVVVFDGYGAGIFVFQTGANYQSTARQCSPDSMKAERMPLGQFELTTCLLLYIAAQTN